MIYHYSLIHIHLTKCTIYVLVGHIYGRYHPHDCCSWHTRPCTVNYTFSNAMNSANTLMNILSYKNLQLQVVAPQLQLLIITPLTIKLFLAKLCSSFFARYIIT